MLGNWAQQLRAAPACIGRPRGETRQGTETTDDISISYFTISLSLSLSGLPNQPATSGARRLRPGQFNPISASDKVPFL